MFTLPEVRGQGVARATLKSAMKHGLKLATEKSQVYTASIVVDADNTPAIALYEQSRFVSIRGEIMPGTIRKVILMKYSFDPTAPRLQQNGA